MGKILINIAIFGTLAVWVQGQIQVNQLIVEFSSALETVVGALK